MDIVNFFEKVEGTWFSQRTTHFVPSQPSQTGQSNLEVTRLSIDEPAVTALCQQLAVDPAQGVVALRVDQDSRLDGDSQTVKRSTVLVVLRAETTQQGRFLSQTDTEKPTAGTYCLEDEVLMLRTETDRLVAEERLWFLNPNLRMRTSLVKLADGGQMASFCSEIRRGVTRANS